MNVPIKLYTHRRSSPGDMYSCTITYNKAYHNHFHPLLPETNKRQDQYNLTTCSIVYSTWETRIIRRSDTYSSTANYARSLRKKCSMCCFFLTQNVPGCLLCIYTLIFLKRLISNACIPPYCMLTEVYACLQDTASVSNRWKVVPCKILLITTQALKPIPAWSLPWPWSVIGSRGRMLHL